MYHGIVVPSLSLMGVLAIAEAEVVYKQSRSKGIRRGGSGGRKRYRGRKDGFIFVLVDLEKVNIQ